MQLPRKLGDTGFPAGEATEFIDAAMLCAEL